VLNTRRMNLDVVVAIVGDHMPDAPSSRYKAPCRTATQAARRPPPRGRPVGSPCHRGGGAACRAARSTDQAESVFPLPLGQQMLREVVVIQQLVGVLLDARAHMIARFVDGEVDEGRYSPSDLAMITFITSLVPA
jgi:hypothetical protein